MSPLIRILVLSLLLGGCSGKKVDENDPASLTQDAEEEIKNDHFQLAVDKLRVIKNKFPYSNYSIEAQLRIADVYFLQESYGEAALSYESFRDLHPKHEKVPYAMYKIAKSHFNDIPSTVARDLTPAQKSLDAYLEFLKKFPTAPEAEEAKKDATHVRDLLAEKELYIGDFYFKRAQLDSAKGRYSKIMDLYPGTPSATHAKEKLALISEKYPELKK